MFISILAKSERNKIIISSFFLVNTVAKEKIIKYLLIQ